MSMSEPTRVIWAANYAHHLPLFSAARSNNAAWHVQTIQCNINLYCDISRNVLPWQTAEWSSFVK